MAASNRSAADSSLEDFARFLSRACDFVFGDVYAYSPRVRCLRDKVNPMEVYSDEEFLFRFRFSKTSVLTMMSDLQLQDNTDGRGTPLPALLKLLITLRFFGSGAMQTVVGDLVNVSQPSVSRCIWETTQAVCLRLFPKYVRHPDAQEATSLMTRFHNIGGFPGVTGCIDCTHVPIDSPGGDDAEVYRNRKGYFSINVQAVTGPELQFLDVVASWPGSVHDSRIFSNSRVMVLYEQKAVPGILLGDQGYACLPYLMPPLRNPRTAAEKRYNTSHIKTRNTVERAFGVWKRRFPCLRTKLLTDTPRSVAIITACAALHNVAYAMREPCPVSIDEDDDSSSGDDQSQNESDTLLGTQLRSRLIQRCFSSRHTDDDAASS